MATNGYTVYNQCVIENDEIFSVDLYNNKTKIGVTNKKYDEITDICNGYYDKLVELGAIVPPKTTEELIAEQNQTIIQMLNKMNAMQEELEGLKNEHQQSESAVNSKSTKTKPRANRKTKKLVGESHADVAEHQQPGTSLACIEK